MSHHKATIPDLTMSDDFDLCECISDNELFVQRLLSLLRQTQNYCADNECYHLSRLPGPAPVQQTSEFFVTCLFVVFFFLMYIIRPRSLRSMSLGNNVAKIRDDISDSSNDPPASPPTGN